MDYNNRHKIFLQSLIQEGALDANEAKELVIKLFKHDDVLSIVRKINEQLQSLDMTIKDARCEITGQEYWVLTNSVYNETTRYQEEFSKAQLALLRNIFSEIIASTNGCVQSTMSLNLCSSLDVKMSKAEAEEFLNDMVQRKWLSHKDGHYYMGVRSIAELMPYFKATYENNLNTCFLCKRIIFHGGKCDHCGSIMHSHCLKLFTANIQSVAKCANCNNILPIT